MSVYTKYIKYQFSLGKAIPIFKMAHLFCKEQPMQACVLQNSKLNASIDKEK